MNLLTITLDDYSTLIDLCHEMGRQIGAKEATSLSVFATSSNTDATLSIASTPPNRFAVVVSHCRWSQSRGEYVVDFNRFCDFLLDDIEKQGALLGMIRQGLENGKAELEEKIKEETAQARRELLFSEPIAEVSPHLGSGAYFFSRDVAESWALRRVGEKAKWYVSLLTEDDVASKLGFLIDAALGDELLTELLSGQVWYAWVEREASTK